MADTERAELTIEELAQRVGMSVRNLREWQGQGLLESPTKRGRVVYYNAGHVERIEQIRALRADGFPLDLIGRTLREAAGSGSDLAAFGRALRDRLQDEEPEVVDLAELAARFGVDSEAKFQQALDERWLDRSAALGLARIREDGRFEIASPRMARLSGFLRELGLPMEEILGLGERVFGRQEEVANIFVDVFRTHVFEPFERAENPEGWAEIRRTLEELRPFAIDAIDVLFKLAMDRTTERTIQEEVDRRASSPDSDATSEPDHT